MGWAFFAGGLAALIMFIVIVTLSFSEPNAFPAWSTAAWFFLAFFILLTLIIFPSLYLSSFCKYRTYNKIYLKKYTLIFMQMQNEGYIEKDLSKYPDTLQMAFYSRRQWEQNPNKKLKYYCSWFGLLSLYKFFYDYSKQQFPINMKLPFDDWFVGFCIQTNIILNYK